MSNVTAATALLGKDRGIDRSANVELKVIGAGFGRTATSSLKEGLETLLEGPCFHMEEIVNGGRHNEWAALTAEEKPAKMHELLGKELQGYAATLDCPSSIYFKEQMEVYPDAKVILSIRDPDSWYKSVSETIHGPMSPGEAWYVWIIPPIRTSQKFCQKYKKDFFLGKPVAPIEDKAAWIRAFKAWNQHVKDTVPSDKLLVWEAKDGWEPLCKFLGTKVPNGSFPHVNDTAKLLGVFSTIKFVCLTLHVLLAAMLIAAGYGVVRIVG